MTGEERLKLLIKVMELNGKHIPVPFMSKKRITDHIVANFHMAWGLKPDLFHPPAPEDVSVECKKQGAKNIVSIRGKYVSHTATYDSHTRLWSGDKKNVYQLIDRLLLESSWENSQELLQKVA